MTYMDISGAHTKIFSMHYNSKKKEILKLIKTIFNSWPKVTPGGHVSSGGGGGKGDNFVEMVTIRNRTLSKTCRVCLDYNQQ